MPHILHEIWIDAPRAAIYPLLSTAEGVSQWWDRQTEVREGGAVFWEHSPGPEHGTVRMRVVERVDGRRIVWDCVSQHPPSTPAAEWTGTRLTFELFDRGEVDTASQAWARSIPAQSVLRFTHADWATEDGYFAFCNSAWGSVLSALAERAAAAS